MNRDQDHLRLLGLFHYLHAALLSCATSLGVVYLGFVATMMPMLAAEMKAEAERERAAAKQAEAVPNEQDEPSAEQDAAGDPPSTPPPETPAPGPLAPGPQPGPLGPGSPETFFSMISSLLYGLGAALLLFGFSLAFANVYTARCIALRKHRTRCLLTAGFNCLNTPLGLILGVCSLIVLLRPSVEDLFAGRPASRAAIVDADIID